MDDILVFMIERYGGWAVIFAVVAYLAAESLLDLGRDLLIDWIKDKREDKGLTEWGNKSEEEDVSE
jgi:hypothetical protein